MKFKKAFVVILIAISIQQVYSLVLLLKFGFLDENKPIGYYWYHEIGALIWFLLLAVVSLYFIREEGFSVKKVFNIKYKILKISLSSTLKYFLGCSLFVILLSFLTKETEFQIENKTSVLISLSFLSAVIFAPIIEEISFRGYLYTAMLSRFKRKKERIVVNAMLFAAAHVFLVAFFLGANVPYYIFILGYFLAKLYEEYRSIVPCVILHFLNNGLVFVLDIIKLNFFVI